MSDSDEPRSSTEDRPTISHLVERLSEQVSRLARAEIALAKAELTGKLKNLGTGIGAFAAAAAIAFFLVPVLMFAIAGFIAPHLGWGWALLIVFLGFALIALGLVLAGRVLVQRAQPLSPERATENIKQDVSTIKEGLRP